MVDPIILLESESEADAEPAAGADDVLEQPLSSARDSASTDSNRFCIKNLLFRGSPAPLSTPVRREESGADTGHTGLYTGLQLQSSGGRHR